MHGCRFAASEGTDPIANLQQEKGETHKNKMTEHEHDILQATTFASTAQPVSGVALAFRVFLKVWLATKTAQKPRQRTKATKNDNCTLAF